jgi:hypothetical protein
MGLFSKGINILDDLLLHSAQCWVTTTSRGLDRET